MIRKKLERFMCKRRCTLLGVGPMSINCINAAIELSNQHEIPLMMIASRRQIDADIFGGGYVNHWTTQQFAEYVIDHDKKGKIILSRDHGGPWQNDYEKKEKLSLRRAMESAKKSYEVDIESGFEIIHIDPSIDLFGTPSNDEILERIFELYEFCWTTAQKNNREIVFEIGTEEQSGTTNTVEELEYTLSEMFKFCRANHLPEPTFVVIQTGTKVMETRNIGTFDCPFRIIHELPAEIQVPKMIDICNKYYVFMKTHNTDYLSTESLNWYPKLGIHSANVAPEFGVAESQAFLNILNEHCLYDLSEQFIDLAYNSKKWEKWILPNTKAGKREKAIIAGHYIFADPHFIQIKQTAQEKLYDKNIDVDVYLKNRIKDSIMRYIKSFRLLRLS